MAARGALTGCDDWLAQETNHHVAEAQAWVGTGAIVSVWLAAIAQLFSGAIEVAACIASLFAVPAIVSVWLMASWHRP